MARIVELILSDELLGSGVDGDPYRRARELWTKDGQLVARDDSMGKEFCADPVKVNTVLDLGAIK